MELKILKGTPKGHKGICNCCRHAKIVRGINMQEQTLCTYTSMKPIILQFPIAECNRFDDERVPSIYAMECIAWEVKSRNRTPAGFGNAPQMEIVITPPKRDREDTPE